MNFLAWVLYVLEYLLVCTETFFKYETQQLQYETCGNFKRKEEKFWYKRCFFSWTKLDFEFGPWYAYQSYLVF